MEETVLGLIRHVLTFGGGFLVTNGHLSQESLETGVGAALTLIGLVWSAAAKSDKLPKIK